MQILVFNFSKKGLILRLFRHSTLNENFVNKSKGRTCIYICIYIYRTCIYIYVYIYAYVYRRANGIYILSQKVAAYGEFVLAFYTYLVMSVRFVMILSDLVFRWFFWPALVQTTEWISLLWLYTRQYHYPLCYNKETSAVYFQF